MDARFTDEQELLRASARELLARECPIARVRAAIDDPHDSFDTLWERWREAGHLALPFAEDVGGAGLGMIELVVLLEELGRALAPASYLASVVLGGGAIDAAGDAAQRLRWLPGIASGTTRAALAWLEEVERWDAEAVQLRATPSADGFRLTGTKRFVLEAQAADLLVVALRTETGVALGVIDAREPGVAVEPVVLVDATRRFAHVQLDGVTLARDALLPGGSVALARVLDRARVALCADAIGSAERALELAVGFARAREQFGRPIGSFQAIQHQCADMLVALESAKSATWAAAWALEENEPDAALAAAIAKAVASDAAARIAGQAIQIHGGLGFTWEHDLHLHFKRAKASERLFGDAAWNREVVARALVDGAS